MSTLCICPCAVCAYVYIGACLFMHMYLYAYYNILLIQTNFVIQFSEWQRSCIIAAAPAQLNSTLHNTGFTNKNTVQHHLVGVAFPMPVSQLHLYHDTCEGEGLCWHQNVAKITGK